jgi:hypothetical protein
LATIDGVGSARELDRLTKHNLAYRWLANGVPVNYHSVSDFRVAHADVPDDLLTRSLAALMAEGLVTPEKIIVDGTKVKASAGWCGCASGGRLFMHAKRGGQFGHRGCAVLNIRPGLRRSGGVGMQLTSIGQGAPGDTPCLGLQRFHSANLAEPNTLAGESNTGQRSPAKPAWC